MSLKAILCGLGARCLLVCMMAAPYGAYWIPCHYGWPTICLSEQLNAGAADSLMTLIGGSVIGLLNILMAIPVVGLVMGVAITMMREVWSLLNRKLLEFWK